MRMSGIEVCAIPGTMCDERLWSLLTPHIDANIHIRHLDITAEETEEGMLNAIAAAVKPKVHLLGFSMGGYLAMRYALSNAENISSLTVISYSARGLDARERASRKNMIQWLSHNRYDRMSEMQLSLLMDNESLNNPEIADIILAMDKDLGGKVMLAQLKSTSERPSLMNEISRLKIPVLIAGGENDLKVDVADLREMNTRINNSQLHIVPQCGHMLPLEKPELLAEQLNRFYLSIAP